MTFFAAPVANHLDAGVIKRRARRIDVGDLAFVDPILILCKICQDSQLQVLRLHHVSNVDELALGS